MAAPTGRTASIRQVSTGAAAVLPNPAATEPAPTASRTGPVAATVTWKAPAGPVTSAVRPSTRTAEPGGRCQRMAIWCRPRPAIASSTRSPSSVSSQRRRCRGRPGRCRNPSWTASQLTPDESARAASPLTRARRPARNAPHTSVESAPSSSTVLCAAVDRSYRRTGPGS